MKNDIEMLSFLLMDRHDNPRAFAKGFSSSFTSVGEFFSSVIIPRIKIRFIVGWSRAQKYRECRRRE